MTVSLASISWLAPSSVNRLSVRVRKVDAAMLSSFSGTTPPVMRAGIARMVLSDTVSVLRYQRDSTGHDQCHDRAASRLLWKHLKGQRTRTEANETRVDEGAQDR